MRNAASSHFSFHQISPINFVSTAKRFVSLCRDDPRLWFNMCDRKWGSKTQIDKWGNGKISYKLLYNTLLEYENLIGFWCRNGAESDSPLIFFEWGPFYVAGSRVKPARTGTYKVVKLPFLWMGITPKAEIVNYLNPVELSETVMNSDDLGFGVSELVPVNVKFIRKTHVVVKENGPSGNGSAKRQRGREGEGREEGCGILKGLCNDMILEFFLVSYDEIGGVACRRLVDLCFPFSTYVPPLTETDEPCEILPCSDKREISCMLCLNSSYGSVAVHPRQAEGRIWQYENGTFGFGFLRDNYVIDLRCIAQNGQGAKAISCFVNGW
ncbi:hypothetical protein BC332_11835 [Capsicum chinense]|nr:hypothetical protein BC332_11835 [Capsicum chinense]